MERSRPDHGLAHPPDRIPGQEDWLAAGGDVYSHVGGIYYTSNGGKSWALDATTGDEMGACAHQPIGDGSQTQVWCVGFLLNGNFSSETYSTVVATP